MTTSLQNNAFHVLGLTGTANARQVLQRSNEIVQRLKIEDVPQYELDVFDPHYFRTEEAVKDALRRLQAPKTRLQEYFFWFRIKDAVDQYATGLIAENDFDRAIAVWRQSAEASPDPMRSAYNRNVAIAQTISLLHNSPTERLNASLASWSALLDSDEAWTAFATLYKEDAEQAADDTLARLKETAASQLSDIYAELQNFHPNVGFVPAFQRVFQAQGERVRETVIKPIFDVIGAEHDKLESAKINHSIERNTALRALKGPLTAIQTQMNLLMDAGLYDSSDTRILRDRVATTIRQKAVDTNNEYDDFSAAAKLIEFAITIAGTEGCAAQLRNELAQVQKNISDERENTFFYKIPGSDTYVIVKPDHIKHGDTVIFFKDAALLSFHAINRSTNGIPTSADYSFILYSDTSKLSLQWRSPFKIGNQERLDAWQRLAHMASVLIIPRIVERLVHQIFDIGQTVKIGGVELSRSGYSKKKMFGGSETIPWEDKYFIPEFRAGNVMVWRPKNGKGVSFVSVPMSTANAVVLPELIPACAKAASNARGK